MKNYYLVTFLLATLLLSSACTKPRFSAIGKQAAIENPVFGNDIVDNGTTGDTGTTGDNGDYIPGEQDGDTGTTGDNGDYIPGEQDGGTGTTGDNDNTGANGDNGTPGENDSNQIPVDLFCSNVTTKLVGYNLTNALNLEVQVIDDSGNIICRNSDVSLKDTIINQKILLVNICPQASGLSYRLRLVDLSRPDRNKIKLNKKGTINEMSDLLNFGHQEPIITRKSTTEAFVAKSSKYYSRQIEVLYNDNNGGRGSNDPNCDRSASPLIVKTVNEDNSGINLTSQKNGIFFDILGENSNPRAHTKKRISWITNASYMFLVKPNKFGRVNGIDEMFGDNTKGPNGEFADDGYAALAKYDINQDKVIDKKDAVYSKLRLWSDKNFDGESQRNELISLSDAGVEAIDLMYDDSFGERDQYGNQTKMKSVVKYFDGSYRLIFDLWFNYEGKRQNRRR